MTGDNGGTPGGRSEKMKVFITKASSAKSLIHVADIERKTEQQGGNPADGRGAFSFVGRRGTKKFITRKKARARRRRIADILPL